MRKTIFNTLLILFFSNSIYAADYYWIGGSGSWSQISHWATTSGGSTVHSSVPGTNDNVIFDANSFSANGETVTTNVAVNVKSMNWSGITYTVNFAGTYSPTIYGDLSLSQNLNWTTGNSIYLAGIGNHDFDPAGASLSETIYFQDTGSYSLQDSLITTNFIYVQCRTFNTNGHKVYCQSFTNSGVSFAQTINLSNSKLYGTRGIYASFSFGNSNLTLDADEAYFYLTGNGSVFSCNSVQDINYIEFSHTNSNQSNVITLSNGSSIDTLISLSNANTCDLQTSFNCNYFTSENRVWLRADDTIHYSIIKGDIYTLSNSDCVFDTLRLIENSNGQLYQINYNGSITVNDSLYIEEGSCKYPITITSTNLSNPTDLIVKNGFVNVNYAYIYSVNASGGASFNGTNIIDEEDNTGWNISFLNSPTFYWIGDNGDWRDPTQWSNTSGGTALASSGCYPRFKDTAIFDDNSFTTSGQTVELSNTEEIYDLIWNGTQHNPTLSITFSGDLNIYGKLKTHDSMTWIGNPSAYLNFVGDSAQSIESGGLIMDQRIDFKGTGNYELIDSLNTLSYITIYTGTFNSNNEKIICQGFGTNSVSSPVLNMGTSVLEITNSIYYAPTFDIHTASANVDFDSARVYIKGSGTASIRSSSIIDLAYLNTEQSATFNFKDGSTVDTFYMNGDALSFENANTVDYLYANGDVTIKDADSIVKAEIYGDFTVTTTATPVFDTLIFYDNNETRYYTFKSNATFRISDSILFPDGNCTNTHYIQSSSNGGAAIDRATISKTSGYLNADYYVVNSIAATGGATFTINNLVDDDGNNTGLNTTVLGPFDLFWVGGTGEWSDATNWSLTSGGTPQSASGCVPSDNINAIFDSNSFSAAGQIVYISSGDKTRNFIWDGVTNNPTFKDTISFSDFNIYGSIQLDPNMTIDRSYGFEINGLDTFTIELNGQIIASLNINTEGYYSLVDSLNVEGQITHTRGAFATTGNQVRCYNYYADVSSISVALDLDTSLFICQGSSTNLYYYSFDCRKSTANGLLDLDSAVIHLNGLTDQNASFRTYGSYDVRKIITETKTYTISLASNSRIDTLYFNNTADATLTSNLDYGYLYSQGELNINGVNININKAELYAGVYSIQNVDIDTLLLYHTGVKNIYSIKNGTTIHVADSIHIEAGDCHKQHLLTSTTIGSIAYLQVDNGYVDLDHFSIASVYATGSATFSATNIYETDGRDNGWNTQMASLDSLYWIGNTGNWNDRSNWSASSGGSAIGSSGCLPNGRISVFFDDNSFNSSNQTVTLDTTGSCYSFMANGASGSPQFTGSEDLKVYGSLILTDSFNFNISSNLYLSSNDSSDIYLAGNIKQGDNSYIYFDGLGTYELLDSINSNGHLQISRGDLTTNNHTLHCSRFYIQGSETLNVYLGTSLIEADDNHPYAIMTIDHSALTLDADESYFRASGVGSCGISCSVPNNDLVFNVIETNGNYSDISLDAAIVDSVIINSNSYASYYAADTVNYIYSNCDLSIRQELQVKELYALQDITSTLNARFYAENAEIFGNLTLGQSAIFDTLLLRNEGPSTIHKFNINDTCYVNDSFYINSNGCYKTTLQSTNTSSIGYISMPAISGFFGQYLEIESLSAIGGGDFNVGINSSDLGNNTGWDFNGPSYSLELKFQYVCIDTPGTSTVQAVPDGFPTNYWWQETVSPFDTFNTGVDTIMVTSPGDWIFVIQYGTSCIVQDSIFVRVAAPANGIAQTFGNNAGDNSWFNCSNWDNGLIPDSVSDATIGAGDTVIIQSGEDAYCYNLTNNGYIKLNGGNLHIYGSIVMNGTILHDSGSFHITGSGTDSITSSTVAQFDSVDLDKDGYINIASPTTILAYLNFIDGYIQTTASDSLIFEDGAGNSGGIDGSFVLGPVYKRGENAFTFPIGDSSILAQIAISSPSTSGSNTFKAEYHFTAPSDTVSFITPVVKVSTIEYWDLNRVNGSGSVRVTLYYHDSARSFIVDPQYLHVGRFDGSDWNSEGQNSYVDNGTSGTVTSNYVSTFSPFTFAAINGINPVPVEFIHVDAIWQNNDALVSWSTASEINNEKFIIERSVSGIDFKAIGEIKSKNGNSTEIQEYSFLDLAAVNLPENNFYYRIKQIDYDGSYAYSEIVRLSKEHQYNVLPNPSEGYVQITGINRSADVTIYSLTGELIANYQLTKHETVLNLSELNNGTYFIKVNEASVERTFKLILINK